MYEVLISLITGIGALACLTFVIGYWIVTGGAWIREEAGQFFMSFMAALGMLFTLVLVNAWTDSWPGQRAITVITFTLFVAETWWPLRLLLLAQRSKKNTQQ